MKPHQELVVSGASSSGHGYLKKYPVPGVWNCPHRTVPSRDRYGLDLNSMMLMEITARQYNQSLIQQKYP